TRRDLMRGRVILLISILSIFLVGCSFNKKDEINLVEQGKTYLAKYKSKKKRTCSNTIYRGYS
ncbi:hypothetical protein ACTPEM_23710, partial [Clostridioides difficile]